MVEKSEQYYEFLDTVDDVNKKSVDEITDLFLKHNCKIEIKDAKSGFVVSYVLCDVKRTVANFVFRKSGLKLRIYPEHIHQYEDFLNSLPESMKREIRKATVCKRLIDPNACNPRCKKGYDFVMDRERYQKCRNTAFLHDLNSESSPFILMFLEKEFRY